MQEPGREATRPSPAQWERVTICLAPTDQAVCKNCKRRIEKDQVKVERKWRDARGKYSSANVHWGCFAMLAARPVQRDCFHAGLFGQTGQVMVVEDARIAPQQLAEIRAFLRQAQAGETVEAFWWRMQGG